jgi:8-amino-7-oxononanoate synthase
MKLVDAIRASAMQREALHLRRKRCVQQRREGVFAVVEGRKLLNFSSNDYLGFAQHPAVRAAFIHGAQEFGVGSAGSALVSGFFSAHAELEQQAAALFGYQACLYVGSGYLANIAVLQTLLDENSLCLQDKLNHACLLDGARFSGARLKRYAHGNARDAERLCAAADCDRVFLVSDGVFSMDGDTAPLADLAGIAERRQATLMIDDAHGVGVLGDTGLGSLQAAQLNANAVPLLIVPAGKALGGQGALILSSQDIITHLVETARPYLFSTAAAPAMAMALGVSLQLLQDQPEHHARLSANIRYFQQAARQLGLPVFDSQSAIQPLLSGSNETALQWSAVLNARGFWLSAIRPPTVPTGKARLRITLTAQHTPTHLDALLDALHAVVKAA